MAGDEIKRYRRFVGWDYSKGASLFITIATAPRRAAFGRIEGGKMRLSELGRAVEESLENIPKLNPGISLFGHVVMPDHVHFNCHIAAGLAEPLKVLGNAIRRFKNYTTKLAKHSLAELSSAISTGAVRQGGDLSGAVRAGLALLWQQGYHDHLCLSRRFINATERYIAYNPMKWELMYGCGGTLRIIEPIRSPRLDQDDWWKGVGNVSLLDEDAKIVSLRVSRKVNTASGIAKVVARMENAVEMGYVIISGFISPGEKAVRDMLCRNRKARFIRILPSCIPNRRFRPESQYIEPLAEGRYLEIGKGNDESAISRSACLDLNAEIIEIAAAGEGIAIYWKPDGPHVLSNSSGGKMW